MKANKSLMQYCQLTQNKKTSKPVGTTLFCTGLQSSQARAEERLKEDVDFCEKFLLALQVGVDPEDIIIVLTLCKRYTDGASSRPILIPLGSRRVKNCGAW